MFDWFPDWRKQICVIVAGGPSSKEVDLNECKGHRVIVINNSWRLAPWADVLFAADGNWWKHYPEALSFQGLKVTVERNVAEELGLKLVYLKPGEYSISMLMGRLGVGGNSGFLALNLAVQFGVRKIVLVGFDMTTDYGTHWHGDHPKGLANPREFTMIKWRKLLDAAYPRLSELGIEVINTSKASKLTAFPKMGLSEALQDRKELNYG